MIGDEPSRSETVSSFSDRRGEDESRERRMAGCAAVVVDENYRGSGQNNSHGTALLEDHFF